MKLAVNYSDALITLIEQEPDLPVDYIKVPTVSFPGCWQQFERGGRWRRLLPHLAQPGVIALGHPVPGQRFDAIIVAKALEESEPPLLSTHLEARVEYLPDLKEYHHAVDQMLGRRLQERFLTAIQEVKARIGVPLVLENFPYYRWGRHYRLGSEPEFIAEVCEAGDCGFLLDIAHARCTAWSMRKDVEDLIDAMPLSRVREIHLSGVRLRGEEGLRDTHTELSGDDYCLFEKLLRQTEPEIVSIEYGGLPDRIINIHGDYEPISRNNPVALQAMIEQVAALIHLLKKPRF